MKLSELLEVLDEYEYVNLLGIKGTPENCDNEFIYGGTTQGLSWKIFKDYSSKKISSVRVLTGELYIYVLL